MGEDDSRTREQLELEYLREVVLARQRTRNRVLAALALGAEILDHDSGQAMTAGAGRILRHFDIGSRPPPDRREPLYLSANGEQELRRHRQLLLLREVRGDLLTLVHRSRRMRFDRMEITAESAAVLDMAIEKLTGCADMDTYEAWQRGMVLKLVEKPAPNGRPRAYATVDAGPGLGPRVVEWDSCERRLALIARLSRAGMSPIVICDRLLADLSISSPLRPSAR